MWVEQFDYQLPEAAIAKFPLRQRDLSKLLIADPNTAEILHDRFLHIDRYLPEKALLVRNVSKVIPARLFLYKPTGGKVELLCLEPVLSAAEAEYDAGLGRRRTSRWRCFVRGKRIRKGMVLSITSPIALEARIIEREGAVATVEFVWSGNLRFREVLRRIGHMPIPPYLRREAVPLDRRRYQTVYAAMEGSVAAPTAGLHFTHRVLQRLQRRGITIVDVVLHVGAGTFLPIKAERAEEHQMHVEQGTVTLQTVQQLLQALRSGTPIVAVGTTALRVVESLYWIGVLAATSAMPQMPFISQHFPYEQELGGISAVEALEAVEQWMQRQAQSTLWFRTQLFILPGYSFALADGLITNFHQPRSTLLLLVAAFVGPFWRKIYNTALQHGYRFLSYGDSSLLWRLHENGIERAR